MVQNLMKLTDVYPDWLTDGIFKDLSILKPPWTDDTITLDESYYSLNGNKIISPMVEKFLDSEGSLSVDSRERIAKVIFTMFHLKWEKLFSTLSLDYDPIANVDAEITESVERTGKRDYTGNGSNTGTIDHTTTLDGTTTDTGTLKNDGTTTNNDKIFGFNSDDGENSNSSDGTGTNTETHNLTNTNSQNGTDTESRNLKDSRSENENTTGTETHTISRHGNIGVTTTQSMITEERNLWEWLFYENVFKDINSILTINIY